MPALQKPLRLRVLEALTAVLESITVANGYQFTLTNAVFRGRNIFGEGDPLPMLAILESPNPADPDDAPQPSDDTSGGWPLLIQGFVKDDKKHPTDPAHYLMADVKKALIKERAKSVDFNILGFNEVTKMVIGGGIVRPGEQPGDKAYFWLSLRLELVEDLEDPFH